MGFLKQSTSRIIKLPRQLDSTDGNTPETGLTIANTDIILWKQGATSGVAKNSGGATHVSSGDYYCTLDSTDTDTLGELIIELHMSGALYTRISYTVLPANIYDSVVAGTDNIQSDMTQVLGSTLTETSSGYLAAAFKKFFDVATPVLTTESINQTGDNYTRIGAAGAGLTSLGDTRLANLDAAITSRSTFNPATNTVARVTLVDTCTTNTDMRGTDSAYTGTPPTVAAIRTEIDSNSTQLAAIKAKTDNLPSGIKKGIALDDFSFVMRDDSDHVTGVTGLTVTGYIRKDDGAFATLTGTISEVSNGLYTVNQISASEMNADIIVLRFTATGADDTWFEIKTV